MAVALMLLATCDAHGENVKPGDRDYPLRNPNPKEFLSIHGTLDKSLDLIFSLNWHAANPECRYYTSFLEGATNQYFASETLDVQRSDDNITAKVPIDGIIPGRCDWKFGGIGISGKSGFGWSLVRTNSYPLKPGQSPNGVVNLRCEPTLPPGLDCRWFEPEDSNASVKGGMLWWHPGAADLEVHINRGSCHLAWCTQSDLP